MSVSLAAVVMRASVRALVKPLLHPLVPLPVQRSGFNLITKIAVPPRGVRFEASSLAGIKAERVCTAQEAKQGAVLYLHGGAYILGKPQTHRNLTGHIARRTGLTVHALDYRLAPEHPFPSAVDDAAQAYCGLLEQGLRPEQVFIMGDSAGGGLGLATALRLRELSLPMPAGLVLLSPWADLAVSQLTPTSREVVLQPGWLRDAARRYLGETPPNHPLASPIHGDLRGLPPVLIQVGSDEILLNDSHRLTEAIRQADGHVKQQEYPNLWHVFQAHAGVMVESDRAVEEIGRFVGQWLVDRPSDF